MFRVQLGEMNLRTSLKVTGTTRKRVCPIPIDLSEVGK
jgi:hypothetical protein